jgi:hypothetical protein
MVQFVYLFHFFSGRVVYKLGLNATPKRDNYIVFNYSTFVGVKLSFN